MVSGITLSLPLAAWTLSMGTSPCENDGDRACFCSYGGRPSMYKDLISDVSDADGAPRSYTTQFHPRRVSFSRTPILTK